MPTTLLRSRVDRANYARAARVIKRGGLTPGDVINIVFAQISRRNSLEVTFSIPDGADALAEYGVTADEARAADERSRREVAAAVKEGKTVKFTGPDMFA
jgi:antitoxin component of RelBE/YafQ-DinJ toxin-antitoxin module